MQFTNNSSFFPEQKIICLDRVDSTNTFAKALLSNSRPVGEGTVILAEEQTAGRGQQASRWLSEAGKNLTFSMIVYPTFLEASRQFALNKAVSLAVLDLLNLEPGVSCRLKWPNDVVCQGGKISGILIENNLQGAEVKASIIGIGINLNQEVFDKEAGSARSLTNLTGQHHDKMAMLDRFLKIFEVHYSALKLKGVDALDSAYINALDGYGEERLFDTYGELFNGIICGVSTLGELAVRRTEGIHYFRSKEITQI